MDELLPDPGAGSDIEDLLESWQNAPAPGVTRDDFAALNQGQLKHVASLFFARLAQVDYDSAPLSGGASVPWGAGGTADDFALVNVGQLKFVFSFFRSIDELEDSDDNGLPDAWELEHFGEIGVDPHADADGDGLTNLEEYQLGLNPRSPDTSGDGIWDGIAIKLGIPATSSPPAPDPNDVSPPVITLKLPSSAVLLP